MTIKKENNVYEIKLFDETGGIGGAYINDLSDVDKIVQQVNPEKFYVYKTVGDDITIEEDDYLVLWYDKNEDGIYHLKAKGDPEIAKKEYKPNQQRKQHSTDALFLVPPFGPPMSMSEHKNNINNTMKLKDLIQEESTSKSQQRLMGMVHATQKGDIEAPSAKVAKLADEMKPSNVEDFASTKHKGLPEKVDNENQELQEKWDKDVKIDKTGEHADKTIEQLKKEKKAIEGKPGNKEKMGELNFAIRAKQGWKDEIKEGENENLWMKNEPVTADNNIQETKKMGEPKHKSARFKITEEQINMLNEELNLNIKVPEKEDPILTEQLNKIRGRMQFLTERFEIDELKQSTYLSARDKGMARQDPKGDQIAHSANERLLDVSGVKKLAQEPLVLKYGNQGATGEEQLFSINPHYLPIIDDDVLSVVTNWNNNGGTQMILQVTPYDVYVTVKGHDEVKLIPSRRSARVLEKLYNTIKPENEIGGPEFRANNLKQF